MSTTTLQNNPTAEELFNCVADCRDEEASWSYDPTAEGADEESDDSDDAGQDTSEQEQDEESDEDSGGYYYGYGCLVVTTGPKLPVAAAFTEHKKIDQETARRVTEDALAVGDPRWILGDGEFDMVAWHDDCIEDNTVPIAPYNERNATDPYDVEYRVEQRINGHSDTVRLWQKQLDETYEQRTQAERTIGACKDCGLETPGVRGRVRVKSHVFLSLCLRLVLAIANYERGITPERRHWSYSRIDSTNVSTGTDNFARLFHEVARSRWLILLFVTEWFENIFVAPSLVKMFMSVWTVIFSWCGFAGHTNTPVPVSYKVDT